MTYTLIPGKPHELSEEETMSMIRSVLTEDIQPEPASKPVSKKPVRQATSEVSVSPANVADDVQLRGRASVFPELAADCQDDTQDKSARASKLIAQGVARLRAFRPTTRHLAIVSVLLLVVVRPHWFVIGAVLCLAAVIGPFMIFGADRIWRGILDRLNRIEATNPARAARLRTKLDGLAYRWDSFLDLFPDGMADGLYMPDFQSMEQSEERHLRAVSERLERMGLEG